MNQTFDVTERSELVLGSFPTAFNGLLDAKSTFVYSTSLGPGQAGGGTAMVSGSAFTVFTAMTTDLSQFVGTGQNVISGMIGFNITVDNPAITVTPPDGTNVRPLAEHGTSTVTYLYGTTFSIPEPSSVVMMTLGLAAVAALAWRRRIAA